MNNLFAAVAVVAVAAVAAAVAVEFLLEQL